MTMKTWYISYKSRNKKKHTSHNKLKEFNDKKYKLENKCLKIIRSKLLVTLEDSLKPLCSRKNYLMYIIREQSFMVCQKCGCIHRI